MGCAGHEIKHSTKRGNCSARRRRDKIRALDYKFNREACHQAFCEHLAKHGPVAMTVAEVATLLNVSERHVYKLVQSGEIPHVKIGKAVRFDAKDIADWIRGMVEAQRKGRK